MKIDIREFKNDVWVFSEKRGEPVRLFRHEYEIIEQNDKENENT
jgi:hypothetical protein